VYSGKIELAISFRAIVDSDEELEALKEALSKGAENVRISAPGVKWVRTEVVGIERTPDGDWNL